MTTELPTEKTPAKNIPADRLPDLMTAAIDAKVKEGFSYGEIANKIGEMNRQTIHQWHTKQTLPIKSLRTIARVFKAFGFKLTLNLERSDNE